MKVIKHLKNLNEVKFDEIAFPYIDFNSKPKLNLNSTTIQAAYTTISNRVDADFIKEINWDKNGDVTWQNKTLEFLSLKIYEMIDEYRINKSDSLLTKIFIWIQLWGGNSGRTIFVRGKGWPGNFDIELYKRGISLTMDDEFERALAVLNQLYGVSTAFSTKHIHFWSRSKAPIYDSIISAIIFGRNQTEIRAQEYSRYMEALTEFKNIIQLESIDESAIERNLFNWANTPEGQKWREIRLRK